MSEVRLSVEPRTEFGKGAARRTRRAGKIPAVLYGHGSDPRHFALPAIEFARVVRENGSNAVITLDLEGSVELALTKTIVVHPLKNYIEHVDLLVVKRGPNAGSRFLLDRDTTSAGRHPDSDIFLDDVTVSRRHAEFHRESGIFTVRDVGSLNGTYVNRERVESATLSNGDEVQIGKFRLVFIAGPRPDDR